MGNPSFAVRFKSLPTHCYMKGKNMSVWIETKKEMPPLDEEVLILYKDKKDELKEKIYNLEYYLDHYAIPDASCHKIKIIPKIRKIIASNFMGKAEYELDYEEYEIVNKALQEQLQKYKDEFKSLKCE